MATQATPQSNPSKDPSQRPGADPGAPGPDRDTVTIPGAGEAELIPPGLPIQVEPDRNGKGHPVVVVPDIQEDVGPGNANQNHPR
jgi:hypothetical protein